MPHLLTLPAEVRCNILSYILDVEGDRVFLDVYIDKADSTFWYRRNQHPSAGPLSQQVGDPILIPDDTSSLAILHVCHQLSAEALPLLTQLRLHVEYKGHQERPGAGTASLRLRHLGTNVQDYGTSSLSIISTKICTITIGATVVEEFLMSMPDYSTERDGWKWAWLQLTESSFLPNLKRFVIFDDGRFGHGPHDMISGDDVPEDHDERVDYYDDVLRDTRLYLFQHPGWVEGEELDEIGLCKGLGGPKRQFDIIYQNFVYDYLWVFIEILVGEDDDGNRDNLMQEPRVLLKHGGIDSREWGVDHQ